jgi:hypothetical protein
MRIKGGTSLLRYAGFLIVILFLITSFFLHCSSPYSITGGETRNELTIIDYLPDGKTKAANTSVTIGSTKNDSIYFISSTDSLGAVEIPRLNEGQYSIYFKKQIKDSTYVVAYQYPVTISKTDHNVKDDTLKVPGLINGVVQLPDYDNSPENLRKITVHILGTLISENVDSKGAFQLKNIATGTDYNLKVIPKKSGYTDKYINGITFPQDSSILTLDTIFFNLDSLPPVEIKKLEYDSLQGIVKISWTPPPKTDVLYYTVYRFPLNNSQGIIRPLEVVTTIDTCFFDTIFSGTGNQYQHLFLDTNYYKYKYRIGVLNSRGEENLNYFYPQDTLTVWSPRRYHTTFIYTFFDSLTNTSIFRAVTNRTFGVAFNLKNDLMPIKIRRYKISNDSIIKQLSDNYPSTQLSDTLYFKCIEPGKVTITSETLDSNKLKPFYSIDSVPIDIYDVNLSITAVRTDPSGLLMGKEFSVGIDVASLGLNPIKNTNVVISCYIDNRLFAEKKQLIENLNPGRRDTITLDSADYINKSLITSGRHRFTTVIKCDDPLIESDNTDNSFEKTIEISDIDLQISGITTNPSILFDGNEVRFCAAIKNKGTTDYVVAGKFSKVKFIIDDTLVFWGYLPDTIKAHDSIIVWSAFGNDIKASWNATTGDHKLVATVDLDNVITETDETNNCFNQSLIVNDFNLKIVDFKVQIQKNLEKITTSAVIIRNGSIPDSYSGTIVHSIAFDFFTKDSLDTTISITLDTLFSNDSTTLVFTRPINVLNYISDDKLTFRADINSQKHLLETIFSDNRVTSSIYKQSIDVNGSMDKHKDGVRDTIYGWKPIVKSGQQVDFTWDPHGERINTSRTISISSVAKTYALWEYPVDVERGKTYVVSGWVRGYDIDPIDTQWPPVSIGFEGTGFLCSIWKTGSFPWTPFYGTIKASDVKNYYSLVCNLGFFSIGNQDNRASGTVTFDDIKLETY